MQNGPQCDQEMGSMLEEIRDISLKLAQEVWGLGWEGSEGKLFDGRRASPLLAHPPPLFF